MKIGTKSLLIGAHAFWLHPWFVAWGWWKLYGFPWDPRLWIAFVIHDWGYWGKSNMDGKEGESHVWWAAHLMGRWFGWQWFALCLFHSRYWARKVAKGGVLTDMVVDYSTDYGFLKGGLAKDLAPSTMLFAPSKLCMADKMAFVLTPRWLYLPMVRFTGEIHEYRSAKKHVHDHGISPLETEEEWWDRLAVWIRQWVADNR